MTNENLIERFNTDFPVGTKLLWRSVGKSGVPHETVTVKHAAYDMHGQPVAFFEERSGCCSILPMFVAYESGPAQ